VLKAGALAPLLSLLERGDGAERYAAAGALSELLGGTPTALAEVANNASSSSKVRRVWEGREYNRRVTLRPRVSGQEYPN
jgi:hypothetical protein